jgi:hypothetical protein
MKGRRLPDGATILEEGDYAKRTDGEGWYIRPPGSQVGTILTTPGHHAVEEHEDGTITVSPSILQSGSTTWHGFLERGVWRTV